MLTCALWATPAAPGRRPLHEARHRRNSRCDSRREGGCEALKKGVKRFPYGLRSVRLSPYSRAGLHGHGHRTPTDPGAARQQGDATGVCGKRFLTVAVLKECRRVSTSGCSSERRLFAEPGLEAFFTDFSRSPARSCPLLWQDRAPAELVPRCAGGRLLPPLFCGISGRYCSTVEIALR